MCPSTTWGETDATAPVHELGESGQDLLSLAFGGGGLAAAFQLGVAHALLASDGRAPHVVVGVSSGAVSAAALAEVLQAGTPTLRLRRLLDILERLQRAPEVLVGSALPDPMELEARRALLPASLPIHFPDERRGRERWEEERNGLIALFNQLLSLRLPVSAATRMIHHALHLRATRVLPRSSPRRWLAATRHGTALGVHVLANLAHLAPLLPDAAWAAIATLHPRYRRRFWGRLRGRLLQRFQVDDSLLSNYPLHQLLVETFDPEYYGRHRLEELHREVLAPGSRQRDGEDESPARRRLTDYSAHPERPIRVVPVAADVASGKLRPLPSSTPLVDALLAATALAPLYPAVELPADGGGSTTWIDGTNVQDDPTAALIKLVCARARRDIGTVRILPVRHLPISRSELEESDREFLELVDVVGRVLELRRFRDATVQRRLTKIYSRLLPPGESLRTLPGQRTFLRTALHPVEPDRPLEIHQRLIAARDLPERRRVLLRAVADGCRATLEATVQPHVAADAEVGVTSCWRALRSRLGDDAGLPGHIADRGPGLAEVCEECALHGRDGGEPVALRHRPEENWQWPRVGEPAVGGEAEASSDAIRIAPATVPPTPGGTPDTDPRVSLLLSGGVFRGVFQVGVTAALVEAGVRPDVFAGSSVGSIMAAMNAHIFTADSRRERRRRAVDLAATFLALDRLILSDTFTDFVRRLEQRALRSQVSPIEVDRLLRRYDHGSPEGFNTTTRRVVAGLERLFYVDPVSLGRMVVAARQGDAAGLSRLLLAQVQKFLDRQQVGREILGSEPLRLLIDLHILHQDGDSDEPAVTLGGDRPPFVLATATNLTRGRLDILGQGSAGDDAQPDLVEALLASSAFPALFRPRWSWELFPGTSRGERYVDGGVMDNLPLDAVTEHLKLRAEAGEVVHRPAAPHLIFTASLEPRRTALGAAEARRRSLHWPALMRRARQLSYNGKIDDFAEAQRYFRLLWEHFGADRPRPDLAGWVPLDIEVTAVKPEWLPDTFGFHPMLGFHPDVQAGAIAHGCASTFGVFYRLAREGRGDWLRAWGVEPEVGGAADGDLHAEAFRRTPDGREGDDAVDLLPRRRRADGGERRPGECWFRNGAPCPFADSDGGVPAALRRIHRACGRRATHTRPG